MQTAHSPLTIADYCAAMDRGEIKSNEEYQRSNKVWPPAARSFLIESIILGFPLPKIFLFQRTDLTSKKTIKEIVDGQQRSRAIHDFFHNKLVISRTSELEGAAGKKYDTLQDDLKERFLSYQLSIDLFVSATPPEIRQAFRRLNSYTVPLNPEELRHAAYQGAFKWFIYDLTREYEELLLEVGAFTEKQIIRMQDEKLFADCAYTLLHGWKTTKAKELEGLYKNYEGDFPRAAEMRGRIDQAMDFIMQNDEIHKTALMKPHILHTLIIAVCHYLNPVEAVGSESTMGARESMIPEVYLTNLTALAEALEAEAPQEKFLPFVQACADKTNTEERRKGRFYWLFNALKPNLL